MKNSLGARIAEVILVCFLVLLLITEILVYYPPAAPKLEVGMELSLENGNLVANLSGSSTYTAHLRATFYLTDRPSMPLSVFVYYDGAYPYSYSDRTDWFGVSQHLASIGMQRGVPVDVNVLNATQLASFIVKPPTPGEVLIVQSGVLPSTVFTNTSNLVTPWIRAGGVMLWSGDKIGYYSGVAGTPLKFPSPANPADAGTAQFLNLSDLGGLNTTYGVPSANAQYIGINYTSAIHFDDLSLAGIAAAGGVVLGNVNSGYTNIASMPLGNGTLIYFGGPTVDASVMSPFIFNLLETGAYGFGFEPFNSIVFGVGSGQSFRSTVRSPLPTIPPGFSAEQLSACGFVFQTDYQALFAETECVPL